MFSWNFPRRLREERREGIREFDTADLTWSLLLCCTTTISQFADTTRHSNPHINFRLHVWKARILFSPFLWAIHTFVVRERDGGRRRLLFPLPLKWASLCSSHRVYLCCLPVQTCFFHIRHLLPMPLPPHFRGEKVQRKIKLKNFLGKETAGDGEEKICGQLLL